MSSTSVPNIFRDLRRSWPGFLISILCLVAVFAIADFDRLGESLRYADYIYFIPSILVFLLAIVTRTFAWRILLDRSATPVQAFFALNEGYLLNNLLPFRLGEFGRGFLLSRTARIGFFRVLSSILIERIFDLSMVVGILLITLPFVVGAEAWARPTALTMAVLLVTALLLLHLLARNRMRALRWFQALQQRIALLNKVPARQLDTFFQGLSALTDLRRFLSVAFLLAVTWALIVYHYYLALLAFVPEGKLLWAAFGIGVVGVGVAVPSAPGSLGIVQGVIVSVFPALFEIDRSVALAYAITVHSIYLGVTSGLGLVGLMRDGQSLGSVYRDLRERMARGQNESNEEYEH